jgi:hypothetical protein
MHMPVKLRIAPLLVATAACLAVGICGLFLLNGLAPRGVVHGSLHTCDYSVAVHNDICYSRSHYEATAGAKIPFVRTSDNSTFTAVTDSRGYYSISLPTGHYKIPFYVDSGPKELDVIAGHQVEADFEVWRLPWPQ